MSENNAIYMVAADVTAGIPDRELPNGNDHFPLDNAYLCEDCDHVGNNSKSCPSCASGSLMPLAPYLNKSEF